LTAGLPDSTTPRRWVLGLAGAAAAVAVLWAATSTHLQLACTVVDTPYLPLCDESSTVPEDIQAQLRDRIRRNPGDSWAWSRLMVAEDSERPTALRGAATLAPNNANVLRWRAAEAFENGRVDEGLRLLIQILEHRNSKEAAQIVAQLAATPEGVELLRPYLPQARQWLPKVLQAIEALKIPPGHALPLMVEALRHSTLPDAVRRRYMRLLKRDGQWVDAYGFWLAHHKQGVPLLYNGGFERAFETDGFDWEFSAVTRSRAGVLIRQHAVARRGLVLELEFTGRRFSSPILRQYIFAPAGSYRLRGEYMASKLRSEGGLAWNVVCTAVRRSASVRSSPLVDTGGLWKSVDVDITIPADCGPVASLQLEPAAAFEAAAGIKGRVELDGFSLTRDENSR
jgi:hypothetical protein